MPCLLVESTLSMLPSLVVGDSPAPAGVGLLATTSLGLLRALGLAVGGRP